MLCGWLQLTENARKWGKERSELLVRLQEAEHGLRGSPLTMTSYPRIVSLQQLLRHAAGHVSQSVSSLIRCCRQRSC